MYQHSMVSRGLLFALSLIFTVPAVVHADESRPLPKWWFGASGAANVNIYNGTAQILNDSLSTGNPFHTGGGVGFHVALGLEYRPNPVWGGMLYVGYDDRSGSWDDVTQPCGENGTLSTTLSYISIEPSLRVAPFSSSFYLFLGPRIGINMSKAYTFEVEEFPFKAEGDWSEMRSTVVSGQVGVGYDIHLSREEDRTQVDLSPFVSYHPYFGQNPRSVENWAVTTVRAGVIIKFGRAAEEPVRVIERAPVIEQGVGFAIRAPLIVPVKRRVRESFPLLEYVFFEKGSSTIPDRYTALNTSQAESFKEEQLQEFQPTSTVGRSGRQMVVYYNILNVLGDRMKRNPNTNVLLSGASEKGPGLGKARAEAVKLYLVDTFDIEASRITTEGRDKPRVPSVVRGASRELALLEACDRRVDILTSSPELLMQIGGDPHYTLKPVQIVDEIEDPLDSHVIVDAGSGIASWTMEIKDDRGKVQRFGPFTGERETIPGNTILQGRTEGDFKVAIAGKTKNGNNVKKEATIHLIRKEKPVNESIRYSILFGFADSTAVASHENYLVDVIAPLIPDSGVVVIHGHSDDIGNKAYNVTLSKARAMDAQRIFKKALAKEGKHSVTFETYGFGEDPRYALFANRFPEERFYNRSVIIDIVPEQKVVEPVVK